MRLVLSVLGTLRCSMRSLGYPPLKLCVSIMSKLPPWLAKHTTGQVGDYLLLWSLRVEGRLIRLRVSYLHGWIRSLRLLLAATKNANIVSQTGEAGEFKDLTR